MHTFLASLLTVLVSFTSGGEFEWPEWRGPRHDGVSLETDWVSVGRPEPLWTANVGLGYSGFVGRAGRLFTMGYDEASREDVVVCLDAKTGQLLWEYRYASSALSSTDIDEGHRGGTNCTPTVAGDDVYVMNRLGSVRCLSSATGRERWKRQLAEEYGLELPTWGFGASAVVDGGVLLVNLGMVLALDRETGELLWGTDDYGHAYSTPTGFNLGDLPALAVFNARGLALIDRTDGSELAFRKWRTRYDINAAAPLVIDGKVYISSGQGRGNALLTVGADGLEPLWENKNMNNKMSGCVLIDGHLYGFHETILRCIDLEGRTRWSHRGLGYGALMGAGRRLIVLDDSGTLLIVNATPQRFELLAKTKVLDGGVYWTRPLLLNGRIVCRNNLGSVVCLDHVRR